MYDFFKALLVGICASAPLGPVVALVIQKTLQHGRRVGAVTGLGSAFADTVYATMAVFFLSFVQSFIDAHQALLFLICGVAIVIIGSLMLAKKQIKSANRRNKAYIGGSLQAALLAFSNPGALALMLALMLTFQVDSENAKLLTILGVASGAVLWWVGFVCAVYKMGQGLSLKKLLIINKILGAILLGAGIFMIVNGLMHIV